LERVNNKEEKVSSKNKEMRQCGRRKKKR